MTHQRELQLTAQHVCLCGPVETAADTLMCAGSDENLEELELQPQNSILQGQAGMHSSGSPMTTCCHKSMHCMHAHGREQLKLMMKKQSPHTCEAQPSIANDTSHVDILELAKATQRILAAAAAVIRATVVPSQVWQGSMQVRQPCQLQLLKLAVAQPAGWQLP